MTDTTKTEAQCAIDKIRTHYGREPICCGCFVEGDPGDGWFQPPDPPTCCQQPDADVAMLLDDIAGALSAVEAERDRLAAECEALRKDAAMLDWLAERLLGADWSYGEPATSVWLIQTDAAISADLRESITAAMGGKE